MLHEIQNIKQRDWTPQIGLCGPFRMPSENHCYRTGAATSFLCCWWDRVQAKAGSGLTLHFWWLHEYAPSIFNAYFHMQRCQEQNLWIFLEFNLDYHLGIYFISTQIRCLGFFFFFSSTEINSCSISLGVNSEKK